MQRTSLPLLIPAHYTTASLRLDLSFGTDEQITAGEFLDALTITLRTTNRSHSITVLTADRFGVAWAPENPEGLLDPLRDFQTGPAEPDPGTTGFSFQIHQRALVQIPDPFLRAPSVLVLSLFDNENPQGSRGVIADVRVRPGFSGGLALESSASAAGPFARELAAVLDPLQQTVTVSKSGPYRFYRLRGETSSRIVRLQRPDSGVEFDYEKELGQPVLRLEGAHAPGGPFEPVNNATFDLNARRITVPLLNAPGFFRITGSHPARIVNDEVSGGQRLLQFEVAPVPPRLESSTVPGGPYAEETGVMAEPFARRLTLPGGGVARFYRIASDLSWTIHETLNDGDNLVLRYDDP